MKKIYLLLFAFAFSAIGFGQTVITNQTFTTASATPPAGWSATSVTFPGGYALFGTINSSELTSPSFPVSAYSSIVLNFEAAKIGTQGNDAPLTIDYSVDGGVTYINPVETIEFTDNNTWVGQSVTINNPGANIIIRFSKLSGPKDIGLRNLVITGNCEPATQASNYTTTNINSPSIGNATLNWTRGSGNNVLVVMRQGSAVTATLVNGSTYTANATFGTGQQIGAGNYVVYNGSASTVNVSGLNINTDYHVAIYEFNSTGNCYKIPALTGNFRVPGSVSYLYADSWLPPNGDPNGISTVADNINILFGNATINTNTLINNVTVNPFSALTINAGAVLQVNGLLTMQSGNLNYSSLMVEGSIIGAIRYERHVNGGPGVGEGAGANDLISSPLVSSQNFGAFANSNPNIRFDERTVENGGDPNNKVFGPFDKATGAYLTWNSVNDAANALTSGVGYRAASTDNSSFVFRGTVNQGIVTNNITYTTTPGVPYKPWNLVGNPYPAYINVGDFLNYVVDTNPSTRNVDILDLFGAAIYGYDGNASDGWTIWNLNTPEKNMAPGQGFLVQADQALVDAYDLTFAPSMRRIGTTDDFIVGRSANSNNFHLKLRAVIGTGNYHTDFYFNDNSSSGLDKGYDATVYGNIAASKSIYSRLVENSTGKDIAIQSLATEALESDIVVPLGIKAAQGQQVTVSIAESDLPSNIEVYLEDNVTGIFTLLNDSDYVFTPSSTLNSTGRFFLRFSDQTLSTPETTFDGLQIFTTASPRTLFIKGQLDETSSITLYDIQGRVVLSSQLETSSSTNQVDVSNLSSGVYVVKLNNASQQKTQKVILK